MEDLLPVLANSNRMISHSKRKSLAGTSQVVSQMPIKPTAMVSSSVRAEEPDEEPNERINVGSNISQVKRALQSKTFLPLPPEGHDEYQKIVDQSTKDASFKPFKEEKKSKSSEYKSFPINPELTEKRAQEYADLREAMNQRISWLEKLDPAPPEASENTIKSTLSRRKPVSITNKPEETKSSVVKIDKIGKNASRSQTRKNPIMEAILWAADVSNPGAPNLRETGEIATRQVKQFGKKTIHVVQKAASAGFHGAKTGIRAFNELSDEIVKNPMLIRMGENNEATLREMGVRAAKARGSIAATDRKRFLTTSSLNKPRVLTPKQVQEVRKATKYAVLGHPPVQANNASTTTAITKKTVNNNPLGAPRHKSASGLIKRGKSGFGTSQNVDNRLINKPRIATASGLITRHHSGA